VRSDIPDSAAISASGVSAIRREIFVVLMLFMRLFWRRIVVLSSFFLFGGSRLPRFILSPKMSGYVGPELRAKIENPLIFHGVSSGQNDELSGGFKANGYDASVLIETCQAIIRANAARTLGRLFSLGRRLATRPLQSLAAQWKKQFD
jgi:hypothetical protein